MSAENARNFDRRAWITGAGKGIGRAVALLLAEQGWDVAISARTSDDLAEVKRAALGRKGRITGFPLDVTDEAAVAATFAAVEAKLGPLDVVMLNAGTHIPTSADNFRVADYRKLIDTNLVGTINGLGAVIPAFRARGKGNIAVVASVAGYRGLPTAAGYGATKAALINMCEALMPELEISGVRLQLICPGFVDTPLTRKNDFSMPFLIPVEEAAQEIVKGLASKRFEIVFPWRMKLATKFLQLLPYPLFFAYTRRIARKAAQPS